MTQENLLQYPIGRFEWQTNLSEEKRNDAKDRLEKFPKQLIDFMHTFPDSLLTKRYRTGSWNAIQVIHHLADSHMHSFLLAALHERWVVFFKSLSDNEFKKSYIHPGRNKTYPIDTVLALYAWHGEHHLAHLKNIIKNPFD